MAETLSQWKEIKMSSFLVNDKSISVIASVMCDVVNDELAPTISGYMDRYYIKQELEPITGGDPLDYKKLCYMLFGLNCRALNCRYGDDHFPEHEVQPKKNASILILDNIYQVYKTIRCYLYQCNEGLVSTDPLFKAVSQLQYALAVYHIGRSPEYQKADWG